MTAVRHNFTAVDMRELQTEWDREQIEREAMDLELERAEAELRNIYARIDRIAMPAAIGIIAMCFTICVIAQIAIRWSV